MKDVKNLTDSDLLTDTIEKVAVIRWNYIEKVNAN